MKKEQLQKRCQPLSMFQLDTGENLPFIDGPPFPAGEIMSTIRGKKVHIRLIPTAKQMRENNITLDSMPIIGICGAGSPNVEFPSGSGIIPSKFERVSYGQSREDVTYTPLFAVVNCYKCIKLNYMNEMEKEGYGEDIPSRVFKCSDREPTYVSYGKEIKIPSTEALDSLDINLVSSVKNIKDVFIIYFRTPEEVALGKTKRYKYKGGKYTPPKKERVHFKVPFDQVKEYIEYFNEVKGIAVRVEQGAKPDAYDRRKGEKPFHVMIPMGRYGAAAGKNAGEVEKILERFEKRGEEDLDISEFNLSWVQDYFESPANQWRVGTLKRRDGQVRRTQQDPEEIKAMLGEKKFQLIPFNLLGYSPYETLSRRQEKELAEVSKMLREYRDLLMQIPINVFYGTLQTLRGLDDPLYPIYFEILSTDFPMGRKGEYNAYVRKISAPERRRERAKEQERLIQKYAEVLLDASVGKFSDEMDEKTIEDTRELLKGVKLPLSNRRARKLARDFLRTIGEVDLTPSKQRVTTKDIRGFQSQVAEEEEFDRVEDAEQLPAAPEEIAEEIAEEIEEYYRDPSKRNNPRLNRVLPLLDRLQELDTMLLDIEREYAQSRRHR